MKVVFIHCPKTAGCSVSRAIGGAHADVKDGRVSDGHRSIFYYKDLSDCFVFTVARNPWDRVVSCFNYSNKREDDDNASYWLMKFEKFKDFVYHLKDIDAEYGLGGEKAFVNEPRKLEKSMGRCYLKNVIDCVSMDNVVKANYICDMHTLDKDWKELSKLIGVKGDLDKINDSQTVDYRDYYDGELKGIVASLYEKDIDYFKYVFEDKRISSFKRLLN